MRPTNKAPGVFSSQFFWELRRVDRLLTGPILDVVYWCGLIIIALFGFSIIGAAVGVALGGELMGMLLALPAIVAGLAATFALVLLWRTLCEFYLVVFRIGEDLRALRLSNEAQSGRPTQPPSF